MTKYAYEEDWRSTSVKASSIPQGRFFRIEGDLYKVLSHRKDDLLALLMETLELRFITDTQCVTPVSVSSVETKVIL